MKPKQEEVNYNVNIINSDSNKLHGVKCGCVFNKTRSRIPRIDAEFQQAPAGSSMLQQTRSWGPGSLQKVPPDHRLPDEEDNINSITWKLKMISFWKKVLTWTWQKAAQTRPTEMSEDTCVDWESQGDQRWTIDKKTVAHVLCVQGVSSLTFIPGPERFILARMLYL